MSTGVFSGNSVGDDGIRPFPHIAFDWSDGIIQMASRAYIAGWKAMNPYLLSLQFGSDHTRAHKKSAVFKSQGKSNNAVAYQVGLRNNVSDSIIAERITAC